MLMRKSGMFGVFAALLASSAASAQDTPLVISLTGQAMIRSDTRATAPAAVAAIQSLLTGDVKFTNFEIVVDDRPAQSGTKFIAVPPEVLDTLTTFGFNMLSFSNNHAFDRGVAGIQTTIHEADKRGIAHAGTGNTVAEAAAPVYLHTPHGTVALVAHASGRIDPGGGATAATPGVNELRIWAGDKPNESTDELPAKPENAPDKADAARILQGIRDAKAHADIVISYQHNHTFNNHPFRQVMGEGLPERLVPPNWVRKWAHQQIDAGADIVVSHGAPLLHGVEIFRGKPIFYDLGNFIFNVSPLSLDIQEAMCWESVVVDLKYQGKTLEGITLKPVKMNPIGAGQPDVRDPYANNQFLVTRGLPSAATGWQATYILQRVADASKPFGTTVELKGDKAEIRLKVAQ
jgi:poly-gamma-glutamate capsule biosynthesis protein CapA/YwtB (metallophosphatase superfamily)